MYRFIVFFISLGFCAKAQTTLTTNLVKDMNSGISNGLSNVVFAGMNGKFYFDASDGVLGEELWVSNGTTAGTLLLKDINPGAGSSYPGDFFVDGNKLYFSADDGVNGRELWVSDGTTAGTTLVADLYSGSASSNSGTYGYAVLSNTVFIAAQTGPSVYDRFLYRTNGTAAGTQLVSNAAGVVGRLITFNSKLWFAANTTAYGTELYSSNGTNAGTIQFMDINGFSSSSTPGAFMVLGSNLLFTATTTTDGNELWKSDGTLAGTALLKNINAGTANSNCSMFQQFGTKAIFTASTSTQGIEPWITDGTTAGTVLLKDINPGTASCATQGGFKVYNNKVYFGANNGTNGNEPWVTDGTTANTLMLKDINPSGSSTPNFKAADTCNTRLIFTVDDGTHGKEPWITDGTSAGTVLGEDMYIGTTGSVTSWHYFYLFGTNIYFQSNTGNTGLELFKLDVNVSSLIPPLNDNCGAATSLTSYTNCIYAVSTLSNATQSQAPNACNSLTSAAANDVWFSFAAAAPTATITTSPSALAGNIFNVVTEVFSACGGSVMACADQAGNLQPEVVNLTGLTIGQTYYFRVFAFKNAVSDPGPASPGFSVCVQHSIATSTVATPPANDNCATATAITSNTTCVLSVSTVSNATQSLASNTCSTATSAVANDVWFSFVAVAPATTITALPATTSGNTFNIVAELFSACGGSVIACADQFTGLQQEVISLSNLTPGHAYSFRVYQFKNAAADPDPIDPTFSVCVKHAVPLVDRVQEFHGTNTGFLLYPHPFGNSLTVSSSVFPVTIKLYDVLGKLYGSYLKHENILSIDTDNLPKGLYILQIVDIKNTCIQAEKIIKE